MKALLLARAAAGLALLTWAGLWLTPDQQGRRLLARGEFAAAAEVFRDPSWRGVAWYRAGEFERAAAAFTGQAGAEARFNEGNARLLLGTYEAAIACYDRALEQRPGWSEALENRALAAARAAALEVEGGESTGGQVEPDEVVFDLVGGKSGEAEEVAGGEALSAQEIQALWLRRVQTRPADFLRAKFAYQEALRAEEEGR